MLVIRGENVYPSAVENVVRGIPELTGEFRIVITREKTMDELIVLAEYGGADTVVETIDTIKQNLAFQLNSTLGIRAQVEMKAPGELERTQFKARRVIDQRDLYKE
jgi:phenylacetate-CoA ligase